ncbi:hypothetical protein BLNAU_17296 [Blattamonas nauphoetae]|nr:hypothetical protein BLNAU_17296 [Blattamonas nauphoetae]
MVTGDSDANADNVTEFDIDTRSQYYGGAKPQYATILFCGRKVMDTPIFDDLARLTSSHALPLPVESAVAQVWI